MTVVLKMSSQFSIELDWSFASNYATTVKSKYMLIEPVVPYTLKGKVETFFVNFQNREFIEDISQSKLQTASVSAPALKMDVIKEELKTAGSLLSASSYITLLVSVLLSFKSNPAFWVYIGMMQLLSYIPLLDCTVPSNFVYFVKEFFGVSKASIPFDSFPSWVPNPTPLINKFKIAPSYENAVDTGYDSVCFIYNFGYQLFTWAIMLALYGAFNILTKFPIQAL